MRVLLSTIGSRGDVQPMVALAFQLRELGHEVRICAPPDFREWLGILEIPFVPVGPGVRQTAAPGPSTPQAPPTPEQRRQLMHDTVAGQFEAITVAARGCDILVAGMALQFALRSIAEQMGIPYVYAAWCPITSPHHAPPPLPSWAQPPTDLTADNRQLWTQEAKRWNDLWAEAINFHRAAAGLAPIHDVRSHIFTNRPWLAADPTLAPWPETADLDVFQTGAWIRSDYRPLPLQLEAFLDAGEPPVYFGFGSMRGAPGESFFLLTSTYHGCPAFGERLPKEALNEVAPMFLKRAILFRQCRHQSPLFCRQQPSLGSPTVPEIKGRADAMLQKRDHRKLDGRVVP